MEKQLVINSLVEMLGSEKVHLDEASFQKCDGINNAYAKAFGVYINPNPIAIVDVENTEEVAKVMKFCNDNKVNLIPRTGQSSGEGLLEVKDDNTIIVDASKMNKLLKIDTYNMTATTQCGYPLEKLEEMVNKEGLTTGHSPQSLPLAHMGGLVATRSIGQFSTYYGGIEDMVTGLEAVMTDGRIIRIRDVPRRSAGPDLRHLFLGSEGGIGFITEVSVKLFPYYKENMWLGGFVLQDIETGFKAIREVIVKGYKPSVVRLYDKADFDFNFGSIELKDNEAFMFFTAEGPKEIASATGDAIMKIAEQYGAKYVGTKAVEHWLIHRNDLCKGVGAESTNEKYRQLKAMYSTTEISASWSDIVDIYHDVIANVPKKIENLMLLGGHVSHSYMNGTNIYFVYAFKVNSPETAADEHTAVINAICEEVLKYPTGGSVHHHGMGKQRVCFAKQEHGTSYSLMQDLKKAFDPNGIMNIGVLVEREK